MNLNERSGAAPFFSRARGPLLALLVGVLGAIAWGAGATLNLKRAMASYLVAYTYLASISLGALSWVMIGWVTRARWIVAVRRSAETAVTPLPLLAILALPLFLGGAELYPWAGNAAGLKGTSSNAREYLQPAFVAARMIICLASWAALGVVLTRYSRRQDSSGNAAYSVRARRVSAAGLVVLSLTLTSASFDAIMSLTPRWASTLYGIYLFSGALVSSLALMVAITRANERGPLRDLVNESHYQAMGKLLLTTVPFWAYIAFCQLIVIWSGGIPQEVEWYVPRVNGEWGAIALLLIAGHFLLPMFALLPRAVRGGGRALTRVAVWLLLMHAIDVAWLVLPGAANPAPALSWIDLAALLALGGLTTSYAWWRMVGVPALPVGDPMLAASLEYRDA